MTDCKRTARQWVHRDAAAGAGFAVLLLPVTSAGLTTLESASSARAVLAQMLKNSGDRAANAGLTAEDLDVVTTHGKAAEAADRTQEEQLAAIAAERSGRKLDAEEVLAREDAMRDRLPAIIGDLETNAADQARWLTNLSFVRYRFRDMAPAGNVDPAAPKDPDVAAVARVEREDIPTRLGGLAAFCAAIAKPGREAIMARFAARGLSADAIAQVGADADAMARQGRNVTRAAEASAKEAAEVQAQNRKWQQIRRMVRKAVKGKRRSSASTRSARDREFRWEAISSARRA